MKKSAKSSLYLAVTPDDLELPLAVCDTVKELAVLFHVDRSTISTCICKGKTGKTKGRKFIRVDYDYDLEDDDEDDE